MPTRRLPPAVFLAPWAIALPAFVSCGNSDSGKGGTGAPTATGGIGGVTFTNGGTPGLGGTVFGNGGAPSAGGVVNGGPDAAAGSNPGGACKKTHEPCSLPTDCCAGNTCTNNDPIPELRGCQLTCRQNSDCATGCCRMFTGGNSGGFCADALWCGCGMTASKCSSSLPACCDTHVCLAGDQQGTFYECRQKCTQNADCATQCCRPIAQLGVSACLDRSFCP